jgi:hypothetical protein
MSDRTFQDPVMQGIAEMRAMLELLVRQRQPQPRRGLSEKTKHQHRRTVEMFYAGKCPCCGREPVLEPGRGQFDHFTDNPNKNAARDTWLICVKCHDAFTRGFKRRDHVRTLFDAYQMRREQAIDEMSGKLL